MPINSTYTAEVDLPNGLAWDLVEHLDSFACGQLGDPSSYSVEVRHASGEFQADSLAEARAEVEAHRYDLTRIGVYIYFPAGVRCVYRGSNWPFDVWNNTVTFYGPSEAQVDGLAAVLRRRLASGALATDLANPDPNIPDETRTPWWKNYWLLTIAAAVIATVIGGIIVAWLTT